MEPSSRFFTQECQSITNSESIRSVSLEGGTTRIAEARNNGVPLVLIDKGERAKIQNEADRGKEGQHGGAVPARVNTHQGSFFFYYFKACQELMQRVSRVPMRYF